MTSIPDSSLVEASTPEVQESPPVRPVLPEDIPQQLQTPDAATTPTQSEAKPDGESATKGQGIPDVTNQEGRGEEGLLTDQTGTAPVVPESTAPPTPLPESAPLGATSEAKPPGVPVSPDGVADQESAPAPAKPLRMDGTTRPTKPVKEPIAGFDAIHPKSQEIFNAAFEARDSAKLKEILHMDNKVLRSEFEKRTGENLPKTLTKTAKAIDDWVKENIEEEPQYFEDKVPNRTDINPKTAKGREEIANDPSFKSWEKRSNGNTDFAYVLTKDGGKFHVDDFISEVMKPAEAKPVETAAAPAEVVADAVKTAVKEGTPLKEQKKFLLANIDEAIKSASDSIDYNLTSKLSDARELLANTRNKIAEARQEINYWSDSTNKPDVLPAHRSNKIREAQKIVDEGSSSVDVLVSAEQSAKNTLKESGAYVTIHVPDDGTFEVYNTKEALKQFKDKVSKLFPVAEPKPREEYGRPLPKPTGVKAEGLQNGFVMESEDGTWHSNKHILVKGEPGIKFKNESSDMQSAYKDKTPSETQALINQLIPKSKDRTPVIDVDFVALTGNMRDNGDLNAISTDPIKVGKGEKGYARLKVEGRSDVVIDQKYYQYIKDHFPNAEPMVGPKDNSPVTFMEKGEVVAVAMPLNATVADGIRSLRRGLSGSFLARAAGSVVTDSPISSMDADGVIGKFLKSSKLGGKIGLHLSDSFDLLPKEVREAAEDAGGTKDNTQAVLHKDGSIWIIRDAHENQTEMEKSSFHEVYGHLGIFRLFGKRNIPELNKLFNRLGEEKGLEALADKYDVRDRFDKYKEDAAKEPTLEMQQARITAELVALVGEKSHPLMLQAKAFWGSIRQSLRELGFKNLSKYTDADIAYLISKGKEQLHKGGTGGSFTVLMSGSSDQSAPSELARSPEQREVEEAPLPRATDVLTRLSNKAKSNPTVQNATSAFAAATDGLARVFGYR